MRAYRRNKHASASLSPLQMQDIKASSEPSASTLEGRFELSSWRAFCLEAAREVNRVVRDELTVSPRADRPVSAVTNTHYRWVAQLWSTEECWLHAPKGAALPEDSNTADCFRDRPSTATRERRSFSGLLRSRHRIPPQLHWPT